MLKINSKTSKYYLCTHIIHNIFSVIGTLDSTSGNIMILLLAIASSVVVGDILL